MAADLASTPRTGFDVQLCGDAHLANFGGFASPDRDLVFSVNDFDETLPGPWEWDVKRLAASIAVAGRERGFGVKERRSIVLGTIRQYRDTMREFAASRRPRRVVRPPRRDRDTRAVAVTSQVQDGAGVRAIRRQGAQAQQPRRLLQAHPRRGRRTSDHQRPAHCRPDRGAATRRRSHGRRAHLRGQLSACIATASRANDGTWSTGFATPSSPARSSESAVSAPGTGSSCSSDAMATTHCSCRSRRHRRRC